MSKPKTLFDFFNRSPLTKSPTVNGTEKTKEKSEHSSVSTPKSAPRTKSPTTKSPTVNGTKKAKEKSEHSPISTPKSAPRKTPSQSKTKRRALGMSLIENCLNTFHLCMLILYARVYFSLNKDRFNLHILMHK